MMVLKIFRRYAEQMMVKLRQISSKGQFKGIVRRMVGSLKMKLRV